MTKQDVVRQNALLPDNYIYISHLDNINEKDYRFWRLPCCPETIQDSMGSTFNQTTALGRSAPIFTYSHSGPRTVQVQLQLHRDMMDEINIGVSPAELGYGEDYVDSLIRALQSIAVPKYNLSNKAVEPPLVALRLSNEVFIKGVVTSEIGLEYRLPIQTNGKYAQVRLSLQISEVDPYDATGVFTNGSFRGVVNTLKAEMGLNSV
jgi:hypothetical protein